MDKLGSVDLFNQSGLEFLRDAAAGAEFAGNRRALAIRLLPAERPGCEIRFRSKTVQAFEIVEADDPNRERGLEYRESAATGKFRHWPVENWATPEQSRELLQSAAKRKAKKASELASKGIPYPPGTGLLIYLNINDFGVNHDAIRPSLSVPYWLRRAGSRQSGCCGRVLLSAASGLQPPICGSE